MTNEERLKHLAEMLSQASKVAFNLSVQLTMAYAQEKSLKDEVEKCRSLCKIT